MKKNSFSIFEINALINSEIPFLVSHDIVHIDAPLNKFSKKKKYKDLK